MNRTVRRRSVAVPCTHFALLWRDQCYLNV